MFRWYSVHFVICIVLPSDFDIFPEANLGHILRKIFYVNWPISRLIPKHRWTWPRFPQFITVQSVMVDSDHCLIAKRNQIWYHCNYIMILYLFNSIAICSRILSEMNRVGLFPGWKNRNWCKENRKFNWSKI